MVVQIAIGFDGDELPPNGQPVQRLAQVFSGSAFDIGGVGHQCIERTVAVQPFGRRFGAHFVHAGNVVGGVAHQGLKVDHQAGRHAKFLLHTSNVAALAGHGVDDRDVRIDQLAQVFVAAGDDDVNALRRRCARQGADHVVGFYPLDSQYLPALQAHHFVDRLNLAAQIVGHGRAVRLVVGIQVVAKGFALGIKHAGRPGGRVIFGQRLHHIDHDAQRPGGLAAAVWQGHAPVAARVKGAVQVAGAIDQQQSGGQGVGSRRRGVVLHRWLHFACILVLGRCTDKWRNSLECTRDDGMRCLRSVMGCANS